MATVSVVAIMKNEEANIHDFLKCCQFADEIVINDTGSTDNSPDIAAEDPKVALIQTTWEDDFSKARNEALDFASSDFIVWLDLDDRVSEEMGEAIKAIADQFEGKNSAFTFQIACKMGEGEERLRFLQHRMFSNYIGIKFKGKIHETIHKDIEEKCDFIGEASQVIIEHVGYDDPILKKLKAERNLMMLLNEKSEDSLHYYNVAVSYKVLEKTDKAIYNYEKAHSLETCKKQQDKYVCCILAILISEKKWNEAKEWIEKFNESNYDSDYWVAEYCAGIGQVDYAKKLFQKVLDADVNLCYMGNEQDIMKKRAVFAIDKIKDYEKSKEVECAKN